MRRTTTRRQHKLTHCLYCQSTELRSIQFSPFVTEVSSLTQSWWWERFSGAVVFSSSYVRVAIRYRRLRSRLWSHLWYSRGCGAILLIVELAPSMEEEMPSWLAFRSTLFVHFSRLWTRQDGLSTTCVPRSTAPTL